MGYLTWGKQLDANDDDDNSPEAEAEDQDVPDHTNQIVSIFKRFDLDGNGVISRNELTTVLQQLDAPHKRFTEADIQHLLDRIDASGADIDYATFASWIMKDGDYLGS